MRMRNGSVGVGEDKTCAAMVVRGKYLVSKFFFVIIGEDRQKRDPFRALYPFVPRAKVTNLPNNNENFGSS